MACPFTAQPNLICASTRSPPVTATSRMFMPPNRAIFSRLDSARAEQARAQTSSWSSTSGSCQWPTTILRFSRSRAPMNPNSRSPWADWFRFMKSMSISPQGSSRLNWVCRCARGLSRRVSPAIHILDGENVCIQVMTPMQALEAPASTQASRISSGPVRVGLHTTRAGSCPLASRYLAISCECAATWARVSLPYRCWLPVRNQISFGS